MAALVAVAVDEGVLAAQLEARIDDKQRVRLLICVNMEPNSAQNAAIIQPKIDQNDGLHAKTDGFHANPATGSFRWRKSRPRRNRGGRYGPGSPPASEMAPNKSKLGAKTDPISSQKSVQFSRRFVAD